MGAKLVIIIQFAKQLIHKSSAARVPTTTAGPIICILFSALGHAVVLL